MKIVLIVVAVWFVLWVIVNLPRGRADGELVKKLHPYRKMLGHLLVSRDGSVVYYDDFVKADALLDYIERVREKFHVDITHCVVKATAIGLRENPRMNQFMAGKRLYARNHVAVTFSMKRKKLNKEAKVSAVKMHMPDDESFEEFCARMRAKIDVERSDAETYSDKEVGFFTKLPRPILALCMKVVVWADYHNLLPWSFIKCDPFYTSSFIANLGSLGMNAAYHHLYEYGTCPLFLMVGQIEDRPAAVDGELALVKTLHLRWSYDERIDDGLTSKYGMATVKAALENPDEYFGDPATFDKV